MGVLSLAVVAVPSDTTQVQVQAQLASLETSKTAVTVAESSGTDTFMVKLSSQPSQDVEVRPEVKGDFGAFTVSPEKLTFTSSNWNTNKTVAIRGISDTFHNENDRREATVVLVADSEDTAFDDVRSSVAVTITDDDTRTPKADTTLWTATVTAAKTVNNVGYMKTLRTDPFTLGGLTNKRINLPDGTRNEVIQLFIVGRSTNPHRLVLKFDSPRRLPHEIEPNAKLVVSGNHEFPLHDAYNWTTGRYEFNDVSPRFRAGVTYDVSIKLADTGTLGITRPALQLDQAGWDIYATWTGPDLSVDDYDIRYLWTGSKCYQYKFDIEGECTYSGVVWPHEGTGRTARITGLMPGAVLYVVDVCAKYQGYIAGECSKRLMEGTALPVFEDKHLVGEVEDIAYTVWDNGAVVRWKPKLTDWNETGLDTPLVARWEYRLRHLPHGPFGQWKNCSPNSLNAMLTSTCRITGLSSDTAYGAQIRARSLLASPPSEEFHFVTSDAGVTAGPGNGSLTVKWQFWQNQASRGRYQVEYCVASTGCDAHDEWTVALSNAVSISSHTITGLTNGTEYLVRVGHQAYFGSLHDNHPWYPDPYAAALYSETVSGTPVGTPGALWSGSLTAGGNSSPGYHSSAGYGSLSPLTFTHSGSSYTFDELYYHSGSSYNHLIIGFEMDKRLPTATESGLQLNIGETAYALTWDSSNDWYESETLTSSPFVRGMTYNVSLTRVIPPIYEGSMEAGSFSTFTGYGSALAFGSLAPTTFTYSGTTYTITRMMHNGVEDIYVNLSPDRLPEAVESTLKLHVGSTQFNLFWLGGSFQYYIVNGVTTSPFNAGSTYNIKLTTGATGNAMGNSVPISVGAYPGDGQARLGWKMPATGASGQGSSAQAASGASSESTLSYEVAWTQQGAAWSEGSSQTADTPEVTVTGLENDQNYAFRVRASLG